MTIKIFLRKVSWFLKIIAHLSTECKRVPAVIVPIFSFFLTGFFFLNWPQFYTYLDGTREIINKFEIVIKKKNSNDSASARCKRPYFGVTVNKILIDNVYDYMVKRPSDNQSLDCKTFIIINIAFPTILLFMSRTWQ